MDSKIFAYDKGFDLMGDPVPESLVFSFLEPVRRARRVLAGRTSEQVGLLLGTMDRYLVAGAELLDGQALADTDPQGVMVYRVKALKCAADAMDPEPLSDVPEVSWADYFASLSLAYLVEHLYEASSEAVERTLEMERRLTQGAVTEAMQAQRARDQLNDRVVEAMDAVAYAEQLHNEFDLVEQTTQSVATKIQRDLSSAGGQGRAKKYAPIRQRVFELYETKHRHRTDRRAALLIYRDDLTEEERAVLQTEDPEITIAKWLGEYRKATSHR